MKMKTDLKNGILIRIIKNNNEIEDRLIPKDCIHITKTIINNKEVVIPLISITETYIPLK